MNYLKFASALSEESPPVERLTVTLAEAALMLGISRTSAYQLAKQGELPGVIRLGHRYVVSRSKLIAAINGTEGAA